MRILVTGGAGFVGSHLVDSLMGQGHEVFVIDNLSASGRRNLRPEVRVIVRDVRESLDDEFSLLQPEVVIHLAAQVSVPKSVTDPIEDLQINVAGTVNVVTAAARAAARKVIVISSAAVYGLPTMLPLTETRCAQPVAPYGLSKLAAEQYTKLLSASSSMAYTILRPANIYGPRQTVNGEGAVVPAFLTKFRTGRDPVIHGDGSQTRDFLYVTDMVRAITQALDRADGCTLNVSSDVKTTVKDLWSMLANLVGWNRSPVYVPSRPSDIRHSVLANAAARERLDWEPLVSVAQGLAKTVSWANGAGGGEHC